MIFVINFYQNDIKDKSLIVIIILLIYFILLAIKNPYKNNAYNTIDKLGTMVCIISLLLGLFIYANTRVYFIDRFLYIKKIYYFMLKN